ncbi:MAG: hypothetical protein M1508_14295 [Nitrospirae bacterium]|nr:hypothetical protein [Nitrospirota bacterium]MCL5422883.1 hypothetical protein [Nitrospirota bacterium]
MVKGKVFFIALVTVLAFTSGLYTEGVFAMGANGGSVHPQGGKRNMEGGKGQGKRSLDNRTEGSPSKEGHDEKTEKPSPEKKPRLKYRDMFECSC